MGIHYENLDKITRRYMREELELGPIYESPRLTEDGLEQWPTLLGRAIDGENDDWLAEQILNLDLMRSRESYTRSGVQRQRNINKMHAAQQLGEGEFNRFYIRGLCRRAQAEDIKTVVVYRGKEVQQPRPESEAKIGSHVDVGELLAALRSNDFVSIEDHLAIPGGPNSGLTARLP